VTLNKRLCKLQSVNGPQFTVINGGGANPCVVLTNATGASLSGFTLTNGVAFLGNGGGMCCTSSNVFLTNCTLTGNAAYGTEGSYGADGNGGGAYGCTLYNCTLTNNSVGGTFDGDGGFTGNGGGAYGCTLYNCTLTGNNVLNPAGYYGGGAYDCTLYNCTLTGNSAGNGTSGAYGCTLYNCIVYYNWECNCIYGSLTNCCTTALPPGSGIGLITNEPLFVNYAGGNLRLQSNSPCINAGNNAFVTGATDLDGNPRIVSGTVDIGAYEYQGTGSRISYAWLQQYGLPTDGSADYLDSDGDGMNNWQEWVCGTCPTNPLSALCLLSAAPTGTNVTVSWQSVAGVNYFLERSASPASPFAFVATNILGQAGTTTYGDTNATGAGPFFYRVGVKCP
jgi:hypothetical protein